MFNNRKRISRLVVLILTIVQSLLVRPVGPFLHVLKVWMFLAQTRVEHGHLHTRTWTHITVFWGTTLSSHEVDVRK